MLMLSKIINSLLNENSHYPNIGNKCEIHHRVWFIGQASLVSCPDPFLTPWRTLGRLGGGGGDMSPVAFLVNGDRQDADIYGC